MAVVAAVLVPWLVFSSDDDDGDVAAPETTAQPDGGVGAGEQQPDPRGGEVPDGWVVVTDDATGISAALPSEPRRQTQTLTNSEVTSYTAEIGDDAAAAFGVVTFPSGGESLDLNVAAEESAVALGGEVVSSSETTFAGRAAVDAEISFSSGATEGVVFLRMVRVDDTHAVEFRVGGPSGDDNLLRPVFVQLVATLQLR